MSERPPIQNQRFFINGPGLRAETWLAEIDSAQVVQIDTDASVDRLRVNVNEATVYDADPDTNEGVMPLLPDFACASCGKGQDEVQTFVVTTLDYSNIKQERTEMCVPCWLGENVLPELEALAESWRDDTAAEPHVTELLEFVAARLPKEEISG